MDIPKNRVNTQVCIQVGDNCKTQASQKLWDKVSSRVWGCVKREVWGCVSREVRMQVKQNIKL
jgi:hypothetical protein